MSVLDCEPLKVIAEVVNLKEEDLVTPEGREGEKGTNSLVNADSFYANFTNTTFQKIPIPHLTHTMQQKFLHYFASIN